MKNTIRAVLACTAAALLTGGTFATAASAHTIHDHHHLWKLHSGDNVQSAVDRAAPGDTIFLEPGTYDGGILVSKPIRIIGSGSRTRIVPPAGATRCEGSGICVGNPADPDARVRNVSISSLQASGFEETGIDADAVDHLTVSHVVANRDGEYGIASFRSTHIRMTDNWTKGDGGEAGIYIGETAHSGALLAGNYASGWANGFFLRDSRAGNLIRNVATGNCAGVLGLDTGTNGPGAQFGDMVAGGDWTIFGNLITRNNRACAAEDEGPAISGIGIAMVGVDHYRVFGNAVTHNRPSGAHDVPSAGVVALSFPTPVTHLRLQFNLIRHNELDVFWDRMGNGNALRPNHCRTSDPGWIC